MKMAIIKIGNSKGIRLPQTVLKQCGIESQVELEVKDNCIVLTPVKHSRAGWAKAFKSMNQCKDDSVLIPEEIDNELLEEWDEPKH